MSYDCISSLKISKKKGTITVSAYPNNIYPRCRFIAEYGNKESTFEEKLESFWVGVLNGSFRLKTRDKLTTNPEFGLKTLRDDVDRALKAGCGGDFFFKDLRYRTKYTDEFYKRVASEYCVPLCLHHKTEFRPIPEAYAFAQKCQKQWEQMRKDLEDQGIVSISYAVGYFKEFPGLNLLVEDKAGHDARLILADKERHNHWRLDDSGHTALYLKGDGRKNWNFVSAALSNPGGKYWDDMLQIYPEVAGYVERWRKPKPANAELPF